MLASAVGELGEPCRRTTSETIEATRTRDVPMRQSMPPDVASRVLPPCAQFPDICAVCSAAPITSSAPAITNVKSW